jgi:ech hydrogenase subunit D
MKQEQTLEVITLASLLERVRAMRQRNARLVQICATALPDQFELTYSFGGDARVPSIHAIYGCAFLYENEMHDLFHIMVEGMAVDFHGNLYNTAVKYAFGETKPPAAKPQPQPQPAVAANGH